MWLTEKERRTLRWMGTAALIGLGIVLWQRQPPPLTVSRGTGAPAPAQAAGWTGTLEQARQVNVNTAGLAELDRLPGVGPALAQRIVEYRTQHGRFVRVEELLQVKGIGPTTYAAIAAYVTVQ